MSATNQAFVTVTAANLIGSTVQAALQLVALDGASANEMVSGGGATRVDKVLSDFSVDGFALAGAHRQTYSGTTPKNIDLTDLTANTPASYAGDTTFAKFMRLVFYNDGAADVTIAPGGSNPASIGLAGTTPTLTVPAGKFVVLNYATAGVTVDSTHKIIAVTPTSGGSCILVVGGA